jgi:putative oxidoreductase
VLGSFENVTQTQIATPMVLSRCSSRACSRDSETGNVLNLVAGARHRQLGVSNQRSREEFASYGRHMTQNLDARLNPYSPAVLSLFRVVFGILFALHGSAILFAWPIAIGPTAPAGAWPLWWAGIIELVTGLLVTVGLFTRIAAFVASGEMAFAYFTQHLPHGFSPYLPPFGNGGEPAILYCFGFFLLVFTGGGAYALDSRRRTRTVATTRGGFRDWRRRSR